MNQPDQTQQTKRRYFVAYFAPRQYHSKRRRPFHKRMTKDRLMQDVFPRHSLRLEISISNSFFCRCPQSNLIYETSDTMYMKHSQRHNNPDALTTLTQSTHLVQSRSSEILVMLQLGFIWQRLSTPKIRPTISTQKNSAKGEGVTPF